jgi:hypothetical protein
MRTYSRQFVNEEGNTISLRVNEEERHGSKGILIYLAGPDSDTELYITPQEAAELLEGLSRVARPKRR